MNGEGNHQQRHPHTDLNGNELSDEEYYDLFSSMQAGNAGGSNSTNQLSDEFNPGFDEETSMLLHNSATSIWNRNIHSLSYGALKVFMDHNPVLYDHCTMLYHQSLSEQKSREAARKEGWEKIEKYVKQLKAQQQ